MPKLWSKSVLWSFSSWACVSIPKKGIVFTKNFLSPNDIWTISVHSQTQGTQNTPGSHIIYEATEKRLSVMIHI